MVAGARTVWGWRRWRLAMYLLHESSMHKLVHVSSRHVCLRAAGLLSWWHRAPLPAFQIRYKMEVALPCWPTLRSHTASLLPHFISYKLVTNPPTFSRRNIRLYFMLGEWQDSRRTCGVRRYSSGSLYKIQSSSSPTIYILTTGKMYSPLPKILQKLHPI